MLLLCGIDFKFLENICHVRIELYCLWQFLDILNHIFHVEGHYETKKMFRLSAMKMKIKSRLHIAGSVASSQLLMFY